MVLFILDLTCHALKTNPHTCADDTPAFGHVNAFHHPGSHARSEGVASAQAMTFVKLQIITATKGTHFEKEILCHTSILIHYLRDG